MVHAGGKGGFTPTHVSTELQCADVKAWLFLEASYKVNDLIAKLSGIDEKAKWEILNEKNSPLLWEKRLENGKAVDECTWGSAGSDDPDDPGPGDDPNNPDPGDGPSDPDPSEPDLGDDSDVDATPHDGDIASGTRGTCN